MAASGLGALGARMQKFIRQKNLADYRRHLAGKRDETQRVLILKLLADEKARERPPLKSADDD